MRSEERAQLIRRLYDETTRGNLDFIDDVYAPNCSFHDPFFAASGVAEMKDQGRQMQAAVPDLHVNVHEVLVDGDMSAVRWTMGGTQHGEVQGMPATGRTFVLTGVSVDKWEDDQIVEEWNHYDVAGMLQQLGLMPDRAQIAQTASQRATG